MRNLLITFSHFLVIALCCIGVMSTSQSNAHAQDGSGAALLSCTTTYGALTTSVGLTTAGIIWLVMDKDDAENALLQYMNENQVLMSEAIITGQGQGIEDLASMSGVPAAHHARFARQLQATLVEERESFQVEGHYSAQHAARLLEAMRHTVEHDPVLAGGIQEQG